MKKKSIVWNSMIYALKSVLGIIFPLITFPYVSNILGPTNIGKVEYANSITNYFIFLAALGIATYAVREGAKVRDDFEALSKLSTELIIINSISSIVAYIGILIVCNISFFSEYALLIFINSFTILFTTIGMEWVYNIKEDFTYITIRYIVMQIISIVFLFVFVKTPEDYYYYAIYIVLATCGSNIINVFCLKKHINIFKKRKLNIKRHIKPVLLLFSISIAATIFANLDTTMLGIMKNETEVGIYQTGLKIDKIVTNVIAAISLVVFSRSSYLLKEGDLSESSEFKKLIKQFNSLIIMVSAPLTVGLMAVSVNMTKVFLSEEFIMSAYVLMIISWNVLMAAIGRIYGHQILIGTGHDKQYFASTVLAIIIDVGLNFILIPYLGAIATAISTVVACLISNIYVIWCVSRLTKVKEMVLSMMKYVIFSLPFLGISYLINLISTKEWIKLILIIVGCVVYYIAVLLLTKDPYLKQIPKLLTKKERKKNVERNEKED